MSKTTVLNAAHRAAGARMVDFGGWDMPVNYGSQIDEHHAVRNDCGMFDVSHMLPVDLTGEGVRDFLRKALANNVDKLQAPGKALYSCMLNEQGGVIDDLIVYFFREDWFRLVVNAGTADDDVAWLESLRASLGAGIGIKPRRDLAMIAVQGPQARARVWQAVAGSQAATEAMKPFNAIELDDPDLGHLMLCRTGYTGEDGFEIMVPVEHAVALWNRLAAAGVRPCGLGARDTLRLEAGMNLYGQDMSAATSPLESGLGWTLDLTAPRDFIGKSALVHKPPVGQLVGLLLLDKGGVLR
ncbi:MAG: glycine cleavage system aminomethyltransferase GcvT, partial [Betaproteobacteria bacterium]